MRLERLSAAAAQTITPQNTLKELPAGGYVLVGVLAFAAAAVVSVLCLRLREKSNKRDEPIKEDKEICENAFWHR